ncbi:hypothetical protein [Palleronia abyssalis]|uniref:Chromosome partition protein Smc n=1 Tax=Palleronia abyssalis TaxID=1501240 RepID=A0A2R8BQF5_9RHOB|nr:hypothetical protein [Palleronia abyssalis]SPJ22390.1 hypothetical protein PAA8504_00182 [Palleronia abyssalis]
MQDITELQGRLERALDRVNAGLERLGPILPPAPEPEPVEDLRPEVETLKGELASERELVTQLEERLKGSRERHESRVAELESELESAQTLLAEIEEDRARLKVVADALRDTCEALRSVNAEGVGDAELVNTAMAAEIETLATLRRSDRSELDGVLALLAPVVAEEDNANA